MAPHDVSSYVGPLQELAAEFKPKNILEIGIGYDGFSAEVWLTRTAAKVTSVDKKDWGGKGAQYTQEYPERYTFIEGYSQDVIPTLTGKYDLIFIDGDHAYSGAKTDMLNCIPLLTASGIIVLDDCDVPFPSAIDIVDGKIVDGIFGVGEAADHVFGDEWEIIYPHINLANGGRIYRRKHEAQSRKRK